MMSELRWILLAAGLVLIAGIYLWGVRGRRRAAMPAHERLGRVEPVRTVAVVAEQPRVEPELRTAEPALEEPESFARDVAATEEPAIRRAVHGGRREPRLEPRFDSQLEPEVATPRLEPRLEPQPEHAAGGHERHDVQEPVAVAAEPPATGAPAQKIVAVRIVAAPGATFGGVQLLEALHADGFAFGRYQIFHRLDAAGRPVVSLASLKEPGTFDPDAMPGMTFRGVALFAVMPGPLPGQRLYDELIVTARALAATLGGLLQDERGVPLSLQRIGQLRDEVAEFERARGAEPGG